MTLAIVFLLKAFFTPEAELHMNERPDIDLNSAPAMNERPDIDMHSAPADSGASTSFTNEEWDYIKKMMNPSGSDSVGASACPKPEWKKALSLPDNTPAPDCLRSHVEWELGWLFINSGRKKRISEKLWQEYMEPLALDKASVGFCKALLERVYGLQYRQSQNDRRPFDFKTEEAREK